MKKLISKEFIIGISVIAAILVLVFGIDYLKGINLFSPANFYYAEYENVQGLETAAPVTINGYKVGQVREIQFDYANPGKVRVLLALNKDLKLPVDSKAELASTLLSGAYVNIRMGSSTKMLEKGSNVPTMVVPDMMASISNDVMPAVNSILPKIDSLLYNLNTLVADPALLASIQRLDGITGNVYAATDGLKTTLKSDIPIIMRNTRGIMHGLDSVVSNLGMLSYNLKELPLSRTVDNVNQITANLTKFSDQLNNQKSTLGMLMNDPELYNRLNSVAASVDSLIVDIKRNPKRYISIKLL